MREHRLYQADWLMRFYGFERSEITAGAPGGMLDLELDPKLAWALANRHRFPIDVNRAEREMLLRLPGIGAKTVDRLIGVRRLKRVTLADLGRLAGSVKRARAFVVCDDWRPGGLTDAEDLKARLAPGGQGGPARPSCRCSDVRHRPTVGDRLRRLARRGPADAPVGRGARSGSHWRAGGDPPPLFAEPPPTPEEGCSFPFTAPRAFFRPGAGCAAAPVRRPVRPALPPALAGAAPAPADGNPQRPRRRRGPRHALVGASGA